MRSSRLPFAFVLLVCASCVPASKAKDINECADGSLLDYVSNLTPDCSSDYPLVYCHGQQSMYCASLDDCSESYECAATAPINDPVPEPIVIPAPEPIVNPAPEPIVDAAVTAADGNVIVASTITPVRQRCVRGVTAKYAYPNNCRYFYQCIDGYLLVQQCPIGFAYNATDGLCWNFSGKPEPISCSRIN